MAVVVRGPSEPEVVWCTANIGASYVSIPSKNPRLLPTEHRECVPETLCSVSVGAWEANQVYGRMETVDARELVGLQWVETRFHLFVINEPL